MVSNAPTPPFAFAHQLSRNRDTLARHVPGHPRVPLEDRSKVWDLLAKEFCSDDLDRIANRLWWMSKQDSGNISPLHRQLVKRRAIVVTEDPKLHLVWIYDRVFIKPLPRYIGSYAFWRDYLCTEAGSGGRGEGIRRAALGYLRTYYHLVKYESDLRIAQDPSLCLVPPDITWEQFCDFTSSLGDVADRDVSLRYTYGEIRLTRLNLYAPLLLGKSHFQRVEYQYGSYFARFVGPILFVIGFASVVLSGMQVLVAVGNGGEGGWRGAAFWISVIVIALSSIVLFALGLLLVYKVAKEWKFAIRDRLRLLEEKRAAE
ncbi:uncharacterized protein B0I36DRAFT_377841 [Microdochium trichocladiopsis]|uniref:Subtilisin-like serine protease n=1 Tax=Microdochium trichocladiopsis TaxID=1682393 RepID=A0A9P8XT23_9PEZI|nr:uncharacterized protein B0I36DRAFT_377841 [Microdochium trichocladiopsis]KAH7016247.1 hypothetical protein B0I36DRAFT_377841 [Microdochium trichocladiopsis]